MVLIRNNKKNEIMRTKLFILGLLLVAFTLSSFAQSTPVVDKKERNQTKRIVHGVKNGELTKQETKQLARQQKEIRRTERRAKADGKVTGKEKRELRRKQTKANVNIYRKKHNKRNRN
jgi:Skp family chaperone for outer membrane proteins